MRIETFIFGMIAAFIGFNMANWITTYNLSFALMIIPAGICFCAGYLLADGIFTNDTYSQNHKEVKSK